MSLGGCSSRRPPSAEHADRLRRRLRFGAIASARSALTQADLADHVVDVGDGVQPNLYEELFARLEQHGLRRCLVEESELMAEVEPPSTCPVHDATRPSQQHSNHQSSHNDVEGERDEKKRKVEEAEERRVPYYYMCVPCELRLTPTSTLPATLAMLQDAHYHFSSAEHRSIASWMGDPDIDLTLQTKSTVDVTSFLRIYLNGIPFLVSTRPGGGEMFYPLPHEANEVHHLSALLYHPLHLLYGGSKQILFFKRRKEGIRTRCRMRRSHRQHLFTMQRIPMTEYAEETFVPADGVPALFPVYSPSVRDGGSITCGAPLLVWGDGATKESHVKVYHDGLYRVALVPNGWKDNANHAPTAAAAHDKRNEENPSQESGVWLTSEMLRRVGGGAGHISATDRNEDNEDDNISVGAEGSTSASARSSGFFSSSRFSSSGGSTAAL